MQRPARIALLLLGLLAPCAVGQDNKLRLDALKKYILAQDYPEVFKTDSYKTRIENVLDVDVDNDGAKELIVLYFPHYRQSAPIIIYKINSDLKVNRIMEGLAPGPLQPVSGDYLDAHTLGEGVDIELPKASSLEEIRNAFTMQGLSGFAAYDTFYHIDGRKGRPWFIDMRGVNVPGNKHDCGSFEFSRVKQVAVGGLREDPTKNYLAAWVGDSIYVYLVTAVSSEGILDKKLWVIQKPQDFNGFNPGHGLAYTTTAGTALLSLK